MKFNEIIKQRHGEKFSIKKMIAVNNDFQKMAQHPHNQSNENNHNNIRFIIILKSGRNI